MMLEPERHSRGQSAGSRVRWLRFGEEMLKGRSCALGLPLRYCAFSHRPVSSCVLESDDASDNQVSTVTRRHTFSSSMTTITFAVVVGHHPALQPAHIDSDFLSNSFNKML